MNKKRLIYFWLTANDGSDSTPIEHLEAVILDDSLLIAAIDQESPGNDSIHQAALLISNSFQEPLWKIRIYDNDLNEWGFAVNELYEEDFGIDEKKLEGLIKAMSRNAERSTEGYHGYCKGYHDEPKQDDYFWRIHYKESDIREALADKGFATRSENLEAVREALNLYMGSDGDKDALHVVINGLEGQDALIRIGSQRAYTAC